MKGRMFDVKANAMSKKELKLRCEWITENWEHFIIVTESLKNRQTIKKLIKGIKQCHNIDEVDKFLDKGKNVVVTYNSLTHIAFKYDFNNLFDYHVIYLDSGEITYPKDVNSYDFQTALERLYICNNNGWIDWIKSDYSGKYTGMRILCENHLLGIDGNDVYALNYRSLDYDITDIRKIYKSP